MSRQSFLLLLLLVLVLSLLWMGPKRQPACNGGELPCEADSQTLEDYGDMCRQAIADVPSFSCLDGAIIPITVNGKVPAEYRPNMDCDWPPLLPLGEEGRPGEQGQCIPFTRVLNFSQGERQIVAACRQKIIRSAESVSFDEIDIIAHNALDGSTCWFQAKGTNDQPLDGSKVPSPTAAVAPPGYPGRSGFWRSPAAVAGDNCGLCHDNDPFMYSPYIGQLWNRLPTNPLGYYRHLGQDFAHWPTESLSTANNACVGCHRIGVAFTSGLGTKQAVGMVQIDNADARAQRYPQSHWMPPGNFHSARQWQTIYRQSVEELIACNKNLQLPNCIVTPIPSLR